MGAHEQDGCSWARSLAISSLLTSTSTVYFRVSLRPGPVFFRVSCSLVGGEQLGLLGCLCGLSVSQQAHMGERLLSELAASQTPWGPDRLSNLSS